MLISTSKGNYYDIYFNTATSSYSYKPERAWSFAVPESLTPLRALSGYLRGKVKSTIIKEKF